MAVSIFLGCFGGISVNNQLIVGNQITSFSPGWHVYFCKGVTFWEHIVGYSDNPNGLNVTAFLVDRSSVKIVNVTIPSDEYAGVNQTIREGKKHSIIPFNYLNYPQNLLKGSTIILETKINLMNNGDTIHYASVLFFDSRDEAVKYQATGSTRKNVHEIDVSNCAKSSCRHLFTVKKEGFYFFVLSSSVDATFDITTNFTFHASKYNNSYLHSNAIDVVNISLNETGFIPCHPSKEILIYTHQPYDLETVKVAHLDFKCRVNFSVPLPLVILLFALLANFFNLAVYCYCRVKSRKSRRSSVSHTTSDERTPLLREDHLTINS